jgi:hypothetical protein
MAINIEQMIFRVAWRILEQKAEFEANAISGSVDAAQISIES